MVKTAVFVLLVGSALAAQSGCPIINGAKICPVERPSVRSAASISTRLTGGAVAASEGTNILSQFGNVIVGAKSHLAAAAAARGVSILAMYPVDTIKTRLQMGLPGFAGGNYFNGVAGSLFGQVPYGTLTFGSYEVYKKAIAEKFPE